MNISRKQLHTIKQAKNIQDKILSSTEQMKKGFALMGASVLVSTIAAPIQANAKENDSANQTTTKTYSDNAFLNTIIPSASSIAAKNDLYASVMLAQAILESGWGTSSLASEPNYNLFGIKGNYNGQTVEMSTLEDKGNQNYYEIKAEFRKYPSYAESLEDYAGLIKNGTSWDSNYYSGAWKSNASTYEDATAYLTGRYATDSAYNTKLNRIIEAHGLAEYDSPTTATPTTPTTPATPTTPKPAEPAGQTGTSYTVKSGDTLYRIALSNGTTVANLTTWNSLKSESIYPGMTLIVSKTTSQPVETAPTTPTVTNPAVNTSSYTVKSGDTLWSISQKYKVTIAQVKSWNNLKTDFLQVGQKLVVSTSTTQTGQTNTGNTTTPSQTVTTPTAKTITVVNGDTLYKIATKAGMSLAELKSVNNLTSDVIYPGQILYTTKETSTVVKEQPVQQTKPNPSVSTKTITVKSGDTLYRLATSAGLSLAEFKSINNLKSDMIYPGQVLVTSKTTVVVKEQEKPAQTTPVTNQSTYTVQKGDTLYAIATKAGASVSQIREWNKLASDLIFVGQSLTLVGKTAVVEPTQTIAPSGSYEVKRGDTLYSIAKSNGISLTRLLEINDVNSSTIYPGQLLKVK
ncbi:LysM peptidoglycan-binding domain-containing protein [Jeotgalibaca arthritidis]|uniref:LysM peptidoglycan-binding domain-containing protein n=1 Tax=Jeotgalibaca arthritidis TaxID=1868794 RepID=UPI0035A02941